MKAGTLQGLSLGTTTRDASNTELVGIACSRTKVSERNAGDGQDAGTRLYVVSSYIRGRRGVAGSTQSYEADEVYNVCMRSFLHNLYSNNGTPIRAYEE